jgi:Fe-Mn family superoxide dismutase
MDTIATFAMMPLPFATDALVPYISKLTMDTHYNRNYKTYVDKTNELISGTDKYENMDLEEVVQAIQRDMYDPLFQQASQVWNHEFYWLSLSAKKTTPGPKTLSLIQRSFGDLDSLKAHFNDKALAHFGSGWIWLNNSKLGLTVATTPDADNFIGTNVKSLMVVDLWEHSYFLDRLNDRKAYLEASWHVVNWDFVESNL